MSLAITLFKVAVLAFYYKSPSSLVATPQLSSYKLKLTNAKNSRFSIDAIYAKLVHKVDKK